MLPVSVSQSHTTLYLFKFLFKKNSISPSGNNWPAFSSFLVFEVVAVWKETRKKIQCDTQNDTNYCRDRHDDKKCKEDKLKNFLTAKTFGFECLYIVFLKQVYRLDCTQNLD